MCDTTARAPGERKREPTNWQSPGVRAFCTGTTISAASVCEPCPARHRRQGALPEGNRPAIVAWPSSIATACRALFARPYADLFRKLAEGESPLVIPLRGGQDRTGIAAALILTSLGVPRT